MDRQQKRPIRWTRGRLLDGDRAPPPHRLAAAIVVSTVVATATVSVQAQEEPPAAAPGFNPPALGEMGAALLPALNAGGANQRPWTITPSISLEETGTDNVRGTANNRESDLITTITPDFFATAETRRLQGTLDYSPYLLRHITATDQDTVAQNLLGAGTLNLYPDLIFFDANVSANQLSRSGARGFENTTQIPINDQTQETSYAASPYVRFHLGDFAQSELRYRLAQTNFSGNTGALVSPVTGQALPAISDTTDQNVSASIESDQSLSKLQAGVTAVYDHETSAASELNSRDASATLNLTYAVTRVIAALASVGYERLTYSQASELNTSGPDWSIGAKYQFNDKQTATLTYGRRQGQNSFAGSTQYAVTPATSVFANYSKSKVTQQQQLLQQLLVATPTGPGTAINQTTGLPINLVNGLLNPNLALQNDILNSQNAEIGVTSAVGRNQLSLVATRVEQKSLLQLAPSSSSNGAFISWGRQLSPSLGSNLVLGYATISPGSSHAATVSAGLDYTVSETLHAGLLYALYSTGGGTAPTVVTNNLTLSITKTF